MISVHVDVRDCHRAERAIAAYMRGLGQRMQAAAEATGGREARARHKYQNRTGNLEASTGAYLVKDTADESVVELKPLAEYAVFVARRGFLDMMRAGLLARAGIESRALRGAKR